MNNKPTQLRMSEREKQQTYQAAAVAISIINERREALNIYRLEVLTHAANNPGNHSFYFNMDFFKVRRKLMAGYMQSIYANSQSREWQVSSESLKIARETGASYWEIKELFLLLMNKHIIS